MAKRKLRIELIPEWRNAWKWLSINAMAAALAIQGAWSALDDSQRSSLPPHTMSIATTALLILGIFGRLVKQKPRKKK